MLPDTINESLLESWAEGNAQVARPFGSGAALDARAFWVKVARYATFRGPCWEIPALVVGSEIQHCKGLVYNSHKPCASNTRTLCSHVLQHISTWRLAKHRTVVVQTSRRLSPDNAS